MSWPRFPQWKHLKMVTHIVFTPVFFDDSDWVLSPSRSVGAWVVFGSSLAAGPVVASVLDSLLPFFFFFVFRDEGGSGLVVAAELEAEGAARDGVEDGGGAPPPPPPPPPAPPRLADADVAAEAEEGEEDDEVAFPRSRLHSSLWPARHAARWQAWSQYFRCRHPEHFCSGRSVAGSPQNAHCSVMIERGALWN